MNTLLFFYHKSNKLVRSKKFKRTFLFLFTVFTVLYYSPTNAQTVFDETQAISCAVEEAACQDVMNSQISSGNTIAGIAQIGVVLGIGTDGVVALGGTDPAVVAKYYPNISPMTRRGALGVVEDANIALMNERPNYDVIAHLGEQWVPGYATTSSVYAQDGYSFLQGINISQLWNSVRMISYALFVMILIWAGFMIMFRHKIGGQMMVTVMNTIPNVVVGLILVTFSFAIVGVMIDIGTVLINVSTGLIQGNYDFITMEGPFTLLGSLMQSKTFQFAGGSGLVAVVATLVGGAFSAGSAGIGLAAALANPGVLLTIGILASFIGIIVLLIMIFIVGYASVKVFITLLKAYIGIIMDTVLAPLYLTAAVLPGKTSIGMDWFYRVAKNISTFVLVIFLINLGFYLQELGINWSFPSGLSGGNLAPGSGTGIIQWIISGLLPLIFFFLAAEAPNLLSDVFPQSGGKGASAALQGVQKNMGKIPGVGSLFG